MDLNRRQYPVLYRVDHLPYSAHTIIPCSRPIPGIIILCADCILHIDQGVITTARAVNAHAASSTAISLRTDGETDSFGLDLQSCRACFLDNQHLMLSAMDGGIWILEIAREGGRVVDLKIAKVLSTVIGNCLTRIGSEYWFLGSRMGDSVLVRYEERKKHEERSGVLVVSPFLLTKQQRSHNLSTQPFNAWDDEGSMCLLMLDIYGENYQLPAMNTVSETKEKYAAHIVNFYDFRICDTIVGVGAVADMAVGEIAFLDQVFNVR